MLNDLVNYIQRKTSPTDWKINGFSVGDDFDSIINDSPLYQESKMIKSNNGVSFYKAEETNLIAGIFLAIPFFNTRQEEILNEIKTAFGLPYFEHVRMMDRILYYPSNHLYLTIIQNDTSKGLCLSIGKCGITLQKFTAANIINSYVGLMNPHTCRMELKDQSSLPMFVRLYIAALESLLLAFLGDSSIKRFMDGEFILECDDKYFNTLVKKIEGIEIYDSPKSTKSTVIDIPSRRELHKFWNVLFWYYLNSQSYIEKTRLFNFTTWKKEQLETMKIISSKEEVTRRLESLKNFLGIIIDPEEKEFDLKEMILDYQYPKEDIAWLKTNYNY